VIAGVAHYAVTDIHPFADGNGRVARLLTAALLMRLGFLPRRLFSFERYYAEDRRAYYAALRSVRANTLNMGGWLDYFLQGLAREYERVAAKVAEFERLGLRADGAVQLSVTQERGLAQLNLSGLVEFSRADYEQRAKVGKSKANRELKGLEEAGLIVRRGQGPAARYRFRAKPWEERRGRKREWTDKRIESELRELCRGRDSWPSITEFRKAGRMNLYEAVRRHGGSLRWAERIGLRN
jgi:Fic family protein